MNTPRDMPRQEWRILIDILFAITGLSFIYVGFVTNMIGWYTYVGAGFLIIALCFMLLSSRTRRGWVEIGVIVFILTGILAFFQPTISQGVWPPLSATNTPSVSSCETFVLSLDKIQSDLSVFKNGSDAVVILLVVGNQTYHYNATMAVPVMGISGSPIASSYTNEKDVRIQLFLDSTTVDDIDTFTNRLASASTIYILPSTATPTTCLSSKSSK